MMIEYWNKDMRRWKPLSAGGRWDMMLNVDQKYWFNAGMHFYHDTLKLWWRIRQ